MNLCYSSGFELAGTQYGKECFCGDTHPTDDLLTDASNCNRPCSGNPEENCGGFLAMSVYETGFKKDEKVRLSRLIIENCMVLQI